MKLLHVTASLDPRSGGPPGVLRNLAIQQSSLGNTMEVATLDSPDAPWLSNFPCRTYPLGPAQFKYRYTPLLVPWLRENANRFDAVIVNGIWQYSSFGTWLALRTQTTPYFVFTHGMLDPWFKRAYPLKHLKKWMYWPWAEYRVLRDAKAVLFTSDEEKKLAPRSFWLSKWHSMVVNYGTAPPQGNADDQKRNFFEQFPTLAKKRLLLFISRIHPKKGCDILIEAFSKLAANNPDYHLVMAGPDQTGWKDQLVEQAERLKIGSKITWTGMLTGDMKWGALHASDVFVLPSHQENFGIVVAEALACGLPVLISDKVNIWSEIEQDKAGFVADDTATGITELLARWFTLTDTEKTEMRSRAIQCFENRFHIRRTAECIVDIINSKSRPYNP